MSGGRGEAGREGGAEGEDREKCTSADDEGTEALLAVQRAMGEGKEGADEAAGAPGEELNSAWPTEAEVLRFAALDAVVHMDTSTGRDKDRMREKSMEAAAKEEVGVGGPAGVSPAGTATPSDKSSSHGGGDVSSERAGMASKSGMEGGRESESDREGLRGTSSRNSGSSGGVCEGEQLERCQSLDETETCVELVMKEGEEGGG